MVVRVLLTLLVTMTMLFKGLGEKYTIEHERNGSLFDNPFISGKGLNLKQNLCLLARGAVVAKVVDVLSTTVAANNLKS